jgi:hypothetical protein
VNPRDLPVLSSIIEAGAQDPVFDGLLVVGPLVIAVVAVLGRALLTEGIATVYIVVFVGYVLSRATE